MGELVLHSALLTVSIATLLFDGLHASTIVSSGDISVASPATEHSQLCCLYELLLKPTCSNYLIYQLLSRAMHFQ